MYLFSLLILLNTIDVFCGSFEYECIHKELFNR